MGPATDGNGTDGNHLAGILSMFAAQSGARKVYAVDASAVAFKAERNIKDNGFSEVITYVISPALRNPDTIATRTY